MKLVISLIFVLSSVNSQAFLKAFFGFDEDVNEVEQVDFLKKQITEKQKLYDVFKQIRQTDYVKEASKKVSSSFWEDIGMNKGTSSLYYLPLGLASLSAAFEITLSDGVKDKRLQKVNSSFLRWAYRYKVSLSMLVFSVFFMKHADYRWKKAPINFEKLYQKYKETNQLLTEEKKKEIRESLKDPEEYKKVITNYKIYFEELKRFDTFLEDLEKSLKKDKRKLEKLEKSLEASDNL